MIVFKLHDPLTETTRRITLPSPAPPWAVLAAKISFLFSIPANNVAVSYIDHDGDEVTLSTEDELEEFYDSMEFKTSARLGGVKLTVKDLTSMRAFNGEQSRTPPTVVPGRDSHASTSLDDLFTHTPYHAPSFGPIAEESPWVPLNHSPFVPMHPHPVMVHVDEQGHIVQLRSQAGTPAHISVVDSSEADGAAARQVGMEAVADIVDSEVSSIPSGVVNTPRPVPTPAIESVQQQQQEPATGKVESPRHINTTAANPAMERELPQIPPESPCASFRGKRDSNPPAYTPTPEPLSPAIAQSSQQPQQDLGYTYSFGDGNKEKPLDDDFDRRRSAFQSIATYPELRPTTMATSQFPAQAGRTPSLRVRNPEESEVQEDAGIESALDANEFSEHGKSASRFGVRSIGRSGPSEIIIREDTLSSIDKYKSDRSRTPSVSSSRFGRNQVHSPPQARTPFAAPVESLGPAPGTTPKPSPYLRSYTPNRTPQLSMPVPVIQPATPVQMQQQWLKSPIPAARSGTAPTTPIIAPFIQSASTATPASDRSVISGSGEAKPGIHVPVVGGPVSTAELVPGLTQPEFGANVSGTPAQRTRTSIQPIENLRVERPNFLNDMTDLIKTIASIVETHPELGRAWNNIMEQVRAGRVGEPGGYFDPQPSSAQIQGAGSTGGRNEIEKMVSAVGELVEKLESAGGREDVEGTTRTRIRRVPRGMTSDPYVTYQHALERRAKLDDARARYQTEKEQFRLEREQLRREKEELKRHRELEREAYLKEREERKKREKEERREAKRIQRRERERNWNANLIRPIAVWQQDHDGAASRYPPVDSAGQAAFIPPSPPRSPYTLPNPPHHLNFRVGAGSSPPIRVTNGFPDVSKRIRRRVSDVRSGGRWEDLRDEGSDLEEKPSSWKDKEEYKDPNGRHGVEVSLYRILERLEQNGIHDTVALRTNFFNHLGEIKPAHPAFEELDREMEDEIFDWLLEEYFISAFPSKRQDRLVKIRSSGTFGRITPVEYGWSGIH